jgi:hypothetical protein
MFNEGAMFSNETGSLSLSLSRLVMFTNAIGLSTKQQQQTTTLMKKKREKGREKQQMT